MLKGIQVTSLALLCVTGCHPGAGTDLEEQDFPVSSARSGCMIGENDLEILGVDAVTDDDYAGAIGSILVARERGGEAPMAPGLFFLCTGVQVSERHVLTAAHCSSRNLAFKKGHIARNTSEAQVEFLAVGSGLKARFDGEIASRWGGDRNKRSYLNGPVFVDNALDFAVFELESDLDGPYVDLRNSTGNIESLALYAHPSGIVLTRSAPCRGVSEPGHKGFHHDCDTMTGSSGGLIIDAVREVPVGLHLHGPARNNAEHFEEYGIFETVEQMAQHNGCAPEAFGSAEEYELCTRLRGMNKGTFFSSIVDSLTREDSALFAEMTDGPS
jgi:hypothetical protein